MLAEVVTVRDVLTTLQPWGYEGPRTTDDGGLTVNSAVIWHKVLINTFDYTKMANNVQTTNLLVVLEVLRSTTRIISTIELCVITSLFSVLLQISKHTNIITQRHTVGHSGG